MRSQTRMLLLLLVVLVCFSAPAPLAEAQLATSGMNRNVDVRTKHARPLRGMVCSGPCKVVANVRTDSYDTDDPNKSNPTMVGWYDPAKAGEMAFIGTTSKTPGDFKISGTAQVVGMMGAGAPGVLNVIGNAAAGSKAFVDSGASGLESSGYLQDDFNVFFPDVILPFTPGSSENPSGETSGTNTYKHKFLSTTYTMDSFSLVGEKAIVKGNTILYVKGNFSMTSGSMLVIQKNASLVLYVGGSAKLSGGILNQNSKPEYLAYFGLPSNTSIELGGNGTAWIGSIYAPQAIITFAGGSDFYGASVSREINLIGSFQFHYDEALGRKGSVYMPIGWKEL